MDIRTSNVVIDGQGYSIYVPKLAENLNRDFFYTTGRWNCAKKNLYSM